MFRFFIFLAQIIIVLFVTLIIINNSFTISLELKDFVYSISSSYIFIIFLIFLIIIFFLQSFYFKTKNKITKYKINKYLQNKEKGYDSFVSGMIALANKDYKTANLENKKITKYLSGNPSLSLLLKSEIYKNEKKYNELSLVYKDMMKSKSTENLAFRGMMEQYLSAQDYHHAFIYGEKLFNNNPFIDKIYEALVKIIAKTNNWQQLLVITDRAFSHRIIDKNIFNTNKSIGFFEIAKIKQHSEVRESIEYILKALKLRKNFPPYIYLYLQLLIQNKNYNDAKKVFKKAWNDTPHPLLKNILKDLANHLKIEPLDLAKFITSSNSGIEESKIFLAEAAVLSKKFSEARNHIIGLLEKQPNKEICLLMAKIEQEESGDIEKVNSWNLRSKNGKEKNIWVCIISNQSQNEWTSVSKSGYFNSLEWRQPYMLNEFITSEKSISYENN